MSVNYNILNKILDKMSLNNYYYIVKTNKEKIGTLCKLYDDVLEYIATIIKQKYDKINENYYPPHNEYYIYILCYNENTLTINSYKLYYTDVLESIKKIILKTSDKIMYNKDKNVNFVIRIIYDNGYRPRYYEDIIECDYYNNREKNIKIFKDDTESIIFKIKIIETYKKNYSKKL